MKRPPQDWLDAVEKGRARLEARRDDETSWSAILRRWGGADSEDGLDRDGCERLIDRFVSAGWYDLAIPPVVSEDYRHLIMGWAARFGTTDRELSALLDACGVDFDGTLTGINLSRLCAYFIRLGASPAELSRRVITPKQIALLQVARRQLDLSDEGVTAILRDIGGVITSMRDLDKVGFRRVLVHLEALGFVPQARAPAYGRRAGMATPEQVHLVRRLWRDYTGGEDEAALNRWLEGSFRVSSLRFATAAIAGKAVDGLRAMIARKPDQVA